jgi:hypothetical protein
VTVDRVRDVMILSDSPDCVVRHQNLVATNSESLFEGECTVSEF